MTDFEGLYYLDAETTKPLHEGGEDDEVIKVTFKKKAKKAKKGKKGVEDSTASSQNQGKPMLIKKGDPIPMNAFAIDGVELEESSVDEQESDKQGFVKKVFGLFTVQTTVLMIYLIMIYGKVQEPKDKSFCDFAGNKSILYIMLAIFLGVTVIAACSMKTLRNQIHGSIAMLLQTISLAYCAGYIAVSKEPTSILICAIATVVIAAALTFAAGKIVTGKCDGDMKTLGPQCGVLGVVVAAAVIVGISFGVKNVFLLVFFFILAMGYFILDAWAVVSGRNFCQGITKEDYMFASMKLYLDLILILVVLLSLCGGDN